MNSVSLSTTAYVSQVSATDAVSGTTGSVMTDGVTSLMPEPKGGDIGMIVAQLAIENAFEQRKQARNDRQHATTAMIAAQKSQITHMREAADQRYEAAKLEAWGKIADGALGITGGLVTAGTFQSNAHSGDLGEAIRQNNSGWGSAASSGGNLASGITGMFAAGQKHDADNLDADAKADEMEATAQKRALENADDEIKETRDHVRTALDFLREFQSTQTKAMASAIKA